MTVTIELPQAEEQALNAEAARLGITLEALTRQAVMEKLIAGVRSQRIPQSLDELSPRRLPPPGKTAMQMVYQQLQTDETDDEIRRALEELS